MLLHLITDYGFGDLAFAEVRQRLAQHLPDADVVATPVPPFDTLSGGFCVGQLALSDGPPDRTVYVNVAPRGDESEARPGNEGEALVAARLRNGVLVVGPNALYTFSFVAPHAATLQAVEVPPSGSQFRSRDAFPPLVARLAAGWEVPGEALDPASIPPVPEHTVVYVDGYGNLKTSWTEPPAPDGTRVRVSVGGAPAFATVSDGTFEVPEGELAFAPGSSGWDGQRFYELFLRGASAAERLGGAAAGTVIDVEA